MKIKILMAAFILFLGISLGGFAFGTPIDFSGSDKYASFEGNLEYNPLSGILSISLTNTTNDTYSSESWYDNGAITGIGFYFPELVGDQTLEFASFNGDANYPKFRNKYKQQGQYIPIDLKGYDFGASTGKTLWRGKVAKGIKPGDSAQFDFGFSGSIADFTSQDFFNASGPGPGGQTGFGVVRFKGIGPGSNYSAKIIPSGGGAQVPEPATIFLLSSGLLGFFGYSKKFWKSKK